MRSPSAASKGKESSNSSSAINAQTETRKLRGPGICETLSQERTSGRVNSVLEDSGKRHLASVQGGPLKESQTVRRAQIQILHSIRISEENRPILLSFCERFGIRYLTIADGPFQLVLPEEGLAQAATSMKSLERFLSGGRKAELPPTAKEQVGQKGTVPHALRTACTESFRFRLHRFHLDIVERRQYRNTIVCTFRIAEMGKWGVERIEMPLKALSPLREAVEEIAEQFKVKPDSTASDTGKAIEE